MQTCILCEDSKVDIVRERAKVFTSFNTLTIPVSPTGQLPATHWFCCMNLSDETHLKLVALQQDSIIEKSDPSSFLKANGLKVCLK